MAERFRLLWGIADAFCYFQSSSGRFECCVRACVRACVHASDASTWFLSLYGFAMRDFGLTLGESDSSDRFGIF